MVEMFRIHSGYRASSSSSAQTEHFESRDAMASRLLALQSEVVAYTPNSYGSFASRIERLFRARRGDKDLSGYNVRKADKVFKVQRLEGEEWVDVEYDFEPARLVIGGEVYSG